MREEVNTNALEGLYTALVDMFVVVVAVMMGLQSSRLSFGGGGDRL